MVPFEAIEHPEEEAQVEPQVPPQPVAVVVGSVPKTKRSHVCSTTASLGYPQHACCVVDLILTLWFWSTYPKFRNPLRSSLMHDTTVFPNATCIRSLDALARWPDTLPAAPDEIVELKTAAGGELVHRSVKGVLRHLVDDPLLVAHLATRPDMLDYTDGSALARAAEAGFRMATFWWTDELCHCICVPFSAATGGFLWAGDVVIVRKHKHRAGDVAGRVIRFATRHGEDMLEVAVGDEAGETAWYRLSRVLQAYSILNPPPAGVHAPQPTLHERRRKAHGHPAVTLPLQMSSDDVRVPCSGALMLVLRLLMGAQATMNKSKRFNHNETM